MKRIKNWSSKNLICTKCGTNKSVKYLFENKPYCNRCIMTQVYLKNVN